MRVRHRGKGSAYYKKCPLRPPCKAPEAAPPRKRKDAWNGSSGRNGAWNEEESAALCAAVSVHGAWQWRKVAALVSTRNPKQCCERWHTQLKPEVNKRRFAPGEV
jgi:hypothetical protein